MKFLICGVTGKPQLFGAIQMKTVFFKHSHNMESLTTCELQALKTQTQPTKCVIQKAGSISYTS